MASLNQMTLIGNIGQDPKIAQSANGLKIASFSVATTERGYTRQDGTKVEDQTEWHNVVLFGKLAEVAERFLHKGSSVFIQGKLKTRSYDGKDGVKRYMTEVVGGVMQMLDPKEKSGQSANATANQMDYASASAYNQQAVSRVAQNIGLSGTGDDFVPF